MAERAGRPCAKACRSATASISLYRHGLDVDSTGTQLAMGSTTGGLWVSDTAGERWQLVNAHLPPIYAVRFT
jgi:hypothetical protein